MKYGQLIRILRKSHKLSQENMAEDLQVDQKTISAIENNKSPLTLEKLEKVAKLFNLRESDFLDFDEKNLNIQTGDNDIKSIGNEVSINQNDELLKQELKSYKEKLALQDEIIASLKQTVIDKNKIINLLDPKQENV